MLRIAATLRVPATRWPLRREFAKKAAPAQAGSRAPATNDAENLVRGLNILKEGDADVPVKPDSEYPDWVFTLHIPRPSLEELTARYQSDPESLGEEDMRRLIRQWNRKRIKDHNDSKRK
jgi:large subunit ribosomal protein L54